MVKTPGQQASGAVHVLQAQNAMNSKLGRANAGMANNASNSNSSDLVTVTIPVSLVNGLTLVKTHDGYWQVVAISPSSELPAFGIHVGMVLLSINNIDTMTLPDHPHETGVPQVQTPSGLITFLAVTKPKRKAPPGSLLTAVLQKELESTKLGIALMQDILHNNNSQDEESGTFIVDGKVQVKPAKETNNSNNNNTSTTSPGTSSGPELNLTGRVFISEIVPKSFGAQSCLEEKMELISINNTLAVDKKESAEQLRSSVGALTLLAQQPGGPPKAEAHHVTCTVQAQLMRENRKTPGIAFISANSNNNNNINASAVLIDSIDPEGPFAQSKLRVGMKVVSINNFSCETPTIAHCLLTRAANARMVTILAQQTCQAPPGTIVTATVVKAMPNSKLGIMLGMDAKHERVIVKYIREGGLLDSTTDTNNKKLEPGMILHRVNGMPIPKGMHNKQVSQYLATLHGTVTFLAEAPTSAGTSPTPPDLITSLHTAAIWTQPARPDQTFGLKLARSNANKRRLVVSHLQEGGLAAASGLKTGMFLLAINNQLISASQAPEEVAMNLIQQARGGIPVTLLVQSPPMSIPPIVTGTLTKATPDAKVGIRMRMHNGRVAIINIAEGSAAATLATDLLAGMLIQSVNNVDCTEKSAEEVANMLATLQDTITIVAVTPDGAAIPAFKYITAAVSTSKPQDSDRLFDYKEGRVFISQEGVKSGLFRGTQLRKGMEVVRLNNMECALLTPAGIQALFSEPPPSSSTSLGKDEEEEEEEDFVTILAARPMLQPGLITEVLYKETKDATLGISFRTVNNNSKVMITGITDGSQAAASNLQVGMELMRINNSTCSALSVESVAKLLHEAVGNVVLVAGLSKGWNESGRRALVTATLERSPGNSDDLGITVRRDTDGKIVVDTIAEGSLAADSNLEKGMELLSVDNVPCQTLKALDVGALLSATTGTVTILAERPPVPKGLYVTAAVKKPTPQTKVGLTMTQRSGKVLIKAIVPESICASSDLGPGMWIKSVNGQSVTKATAATVARLLGAQTSLVTILAETTDETFDDDEAKEDDQAKEEEQVNEEEAQEGKEEVVTAEETAASEEAEEDSKPAAKEDGEEAEEQKEGSEALVDIDVDAVDEEQEPEDEGIVSAKADC
ncbi:expressed unknown protein [Seminavis robusta]|uniref:PDZ domain-containing protein n=1 Tax=Seminavis robusta TaxID=568900 RepID=A0A9N8DHP4_9STRA|nr:expressed unknown protein [Seminavis robusta]|eukprot:Sro96_g049470.1 n/a (1141) ;mRNA; r:12479-16005